MTKVKMTKVIDSVNWNKVSDKNSIPKKAIKEAVKKLGNSNRLAIAMDTHNGLICQWIHKKCPRGKDLMHPTSAVKMQKAAKIKGLAVRLCPSIKK